MKQSFIIVTFAIVSLLHSAIGQSVLGQMTLRHQDPLPVILIHGYYEDKSVWNRWVQLLQDDHLPNNWIFPVTFKASGPCSGIVLPGSTLRATCDPCGSADQHTQELVQWVQLAKNMTGADKVNIVGHSKGGLDARVYLGNNLSNTDVANLIMIGTPNSGSPLADPLLDPCTPAVSDITVGAPDTTAYENIHTHYYTIAGDWNPSTTPCSFLDVGGYEYYISQPIPQANDGIVPVWSVESPVEPYFNHLPHSPNCHQDLTGELEYHLAQNILLGR